MSSKGLKFEEAVEVITSNCGAGARELLSRDPERFPIAAVRELSGTSPDYQRHVLTRAEAGDPKPLKKIAASLVVYETVAFYEVVTRVGRAVGCVRREAALIDRAIETGKPPDRLADRLLTLDLIREHSRRLLDLLTDVPTVSRREKATAKRSPAESSEEVPNKLNAPAALGLIAKNVRDVAVLRAEHRPTVRQKAFALQLTTQIHRLAVQARAAGRRAFGPADAACRVRPKYTANRRVITHDEVDGDAVAAAWLAERFLFAGEVAEVLFVPRERVLGAYRVGDCLVDVGNTHDPLHHFFDHKPPAFADRNDACAASLVWRQLERLGRPVQHLGPLVDVVFAGDSPRQRSWFKEAYADSKRKGFHKTLADAKLGGATDAEVYRAVRGWLDRFHRKTLTPR